ncbi:MAG: hypothetical protein Q9210_005940 [Variospora velana]
MHHLHIFHLFLPSILLGFFSLSIALPPSNHHTGSVDDIRDHSLQSPNSIIHTAALQPLPNLKPRSDVWDQLSSLPIPIFGYPAYHLKLTSYSPLYRDNSLGPVPSNNASTALSSFFGSVVSKSNYFARQNRATKAAMAFGAKRMWINFYGSEEEGLRWKDLEWVAARARGWSEKGLVGVWEAVLSPEGQNRQVGVQVKVIP